MMNSKKERDSRFELLRIISMLLIVICHVSLIPSHLVPGNESIVTLQNNYSNAQAAQILGMFARIGNLLFVMVSGYFMINLKFKVSRINKLIDKVHMYTWPFIIIVPLLGISLGIRGWAMLIFPVVASQYWFVTVFLALMIISPIINMVIHRLSQQKAFMLLIILFTFTSVIPTLSLNASNLPSLADLGIFITVYMAAGLIRLYPDSFNWPKALVFLAVLISIGIQFIFLLFINGVAMPMKNIQLVHHAAYLNSQESVFVLFAAFFIFIIVSRINPFSSRLIDIVATSTFGIYLIHEHIIISSKITHLIVIKSLINSCSVELFILMVIIISVGIFIACSIIDLFYSWIISCLGVYKYLDKLNNWIWHLVYSYVRQMFKIKEL